MKYSDIINSAFNFLYLNNVNFPGVISHPIFKCVDNEGVFDMFFLLKDDEGELCVDNLSLIFLCGINGNGAGFWNGADLLANESITDINLDFSLIKDEKEEIFAELYEKVRSFVFKESLSAEEKKAALKLAKKYDNSLGRELYHILSPEFFDWVKDIAES